MSNPFNSASVLGSDAKINRRSENVTKLDDGVVDFEKLALILRNEVRSTMVEVFAEWGVKQSPFDPSAQANLAEIPARRIYNEEEASAVIGKNKQYLRARFCKIGTADIEQAQINAQFPRFLKSGQSRRYLGSSLIAFQQGFDPKGV